MNKSLAFLDKSKLKDGITFSPVVSEETFMSLFLILREFMTQGKIIY